MYTIEIVQSPLSTSCKEELIQTCREFLKNNENFSNRIITDFNSDKFLTTNVEAIIIDEDCSQNVSSSADTKADFNKWVVYRLDGVGPQEDVIHSDDELLQLSSNWMLPSADLHCLWENLIYDSDIKHNLLRFVETTLVFGAHRVDPNIVTSNRMVLLHGPPGTGKTSLCRALAHKVAARLRHVYVTAQLIEINSHSLFSKWFSESGKLVTKMFTRIRQLTDDPDCLVFVLIDEVESLAHARSQAMSATEPSDSIRVVNAVLTQLDQMRRYPNVLILTTSNMTGAIDLAFVDRADIKQYIGLPSVQAIYQIYYTCLQELLRAKIISPTEVLLSLSALKLQSENNPSASAKLLTICQNSYGFSGRTLRKIPFLAHALFVAREMVTLSDFLEAMHMAVEKNKLDNEQMKESAKQI